MPPRDASPANAVQPQTRERRGAGRAVSVLRVARLVTDTGDQLCVVRNLSPTGLMIETSDPPTIGDAVWVEFTTTVRVRGTVRWAVEDRFGIAFDQETDLLGVLDRPDGRLRRQRTRSPRFTRAGTVRVATTLGAIDGVVRNLSLGGVGITLTAGSLARGDRVRLSISGLPRRDGEVRWVKGSTVGVWFESPLQFRDLAGRVNDPA